MKFENMPNQISESIADKEENRREILKHCKLEIYDKEKIKWNEIREDILAIENDAFAEEAFDEKMLREDFENQQSVVIVIRDTRTNKIVGFTYAQPTIFVYPDLYGDRKFSEDTAYVSDIVIHPEYRKKGLLPLLMDNLKNKLIERGYSFMEMDSADDRTNLKEEEKTFADKIKKNNLNRIIAEEEWNSEEYGMQRYFRIRLDKTQN